MIILCDDPIQKTRVVAAVMVVWFGVTTKILLFQTSASHRLFLYLAKIVSQIIFYVLRNRLVHFSCVYLHTKKMCSELLNNVVSIREVFSLSIYDWVSPGDALQYIIESSLFIPQLSRKSYFLWLRFVCVSFQVSSVDTTPVCYHHHCNRVRMNISFRQMMMKIWYNA